MLRDMLKDLNVLVMRSEANMTAIMSLHEWQTVLLPVFRLLPFSKEARSDVHKEAVKYGVNFYAMLHAYYVKRPDGRRGTLGEAIASTTLQMAVHSGWNERAVGLTRRVLAGLVGKVGSSARSWKNNLDAPEWSVVFALVKSIENFLFYRPTILEDESHNGTLEVEELLDGQDGENDKRVRRSVSGEDCPTSVWGRPYRTMIVPHSNAVGRNPKRRDLYQRRLAGGNASGIGLHIDVEGKCADTALVEAVLRLFSACGLQGVAGEEEVIDPSATRKQKSKLKYASEIVRGFTKIKTMFGHIEDADDKAKDKSIKSVMKYLTSRSEVGLLAFKARQKASVQQLKHALVQQEAARIIRKTAIATMKTAILSRQVVIIGADDAKDEESGEDEVSGEGPEMDWTNLCRACALPLDDDDFTVEAHEFKWHQKCMQCTHDGCDEQLTPSTCYVNPASGGGQLLCKRHMVVTCGSQYAPVA